jgi:hypothetical protein
MKRRIRVVRRNGRCRSDARARRRSWRSARDSGSSSIIPGIETGAPERTETSSGVAVSPSPRPVASVETAGRWSSTSARNSGENVRVRPGYSTHTEARDG